VFSKFEWENKEMINHPTDSDYVQKVQPPKNTQEPCKYVQSMGSRFKNADLLNTGGWRWDVDLGTVVASCKYFLFYLVVGWYEIVTSHPIFEFSISGRWRRPAIIDFTYDVTQRRKVKSLV